jgi:hypothetical protein
MEHEDIIRKLARLADEVEALAKTKASEVEVEEDPRIVMLTLEMEKIIEELDPMVLETFRNNPAKVAEWKKIMEFDNDED